MDLLKLAKASLNRNNEVLGEFFENEEGNFSGTVLLILGLLISACYPFLWKGKLQDNVVRSIREITVFIIVSILFVFILTYFSQKIDKSTTMCQIYRIVSVTSIYRILGTFIDYSFGLFGIYFPMNILFWMIGFLQVGIVISDNISVSKKITVTISVLTFILNLVISLTFFTIITELIFL